MDEDDLPPPPREPSASFGGQIGWTVGGALWILVPMAIVCALIYFAAKAFGH